MADFTNEQDLFAFLQRVGFNPSIPSAQQPPNVQNAIRGVTFQGQPVLQETPLAQRTTPLPGGPAPIAPGVSVQARAPGLGPVGAQPLVRPDTFALAGLPADTERTTREIGQAVQQTPQPLLPFQGPGFPQVGAQAGAQVPGAAPVPGAPGAPAPTAAPGDAIANVDAQARAELEAEGKEVTPGALDKRRVGLGVTMLSTGLGQMQQGATALSPRETQGGLFTMLGGYMTLATKPGQEDTLWGRMGPAIGFLGTVMNIMGQRQSGELRNRHLEKEADRRVRLTESIGEALTHLNSL